jgi:hypothetical protein
MNRTVPSMKTLISPNARACMAMVAFALCVQSAAFATGNKPAGMQDPLFRPGSDTIHSIQVSKSQSSKKHKIRLYPDARQQVLFFSANGQDGKVYQLFLFDMDGRLVSQTRIRNRETTVLTNISEGNFLFEVFTDDERIENGQLTVR